MGKKKGYLKEREQQEDYLKSPKSEAISQAEWAETLRRQETREVECQTKYQNIFLRLQFVTKEEEEY